MFIFWLSEHFIFQPHNSICRNQKLIPFQFIQKSICFFFCKKKCNAFLSQIRGIRFIGLFNPCFKSKTKRLQQHLSSRRSGTEYKFSLRHKSGEEKIIKWQHGEDSEQHNYFQQRAQQGIIFFFFCPYRKSQQRQERNFKAGENFPEAKILVTVKEVVQNFSCSQS